MYQFTGLLKWITFLCYTSIFKIIYLFCVCLSRRVTHVTISLCRLRRRSKHLSERMPAQVVSWRCDSSPCATVDVMESKVGLLASLLSEDAAPPERVGKISHGEENKKLLILLPGNPCIVECYAEFVRFLHEDRRCDVLVLGYAGHSLAPHNGHRLFGLNDQIELCHTFFHRLFHSSAAITKNRYNGHVFLAGHSIGAFIGLHMLARFEADIKLFFGLAPVLTYIKASPNGRWISFMEVPLVRDVAAFTCSLLAFLPSPLKKLLTRYGTKEVERGLKCELIRRVHRSQLHNVIYMTKDELRMVAEPDWVLLKALQKKMVLYYVPKDRWAPEAHAEEIHQGCSSLRAYIMEEAELQVSHAWCLAHSKRVVDRIAPFIS